MLYAGCVQYLSAGTGITHSEMNDGDETCRFLQVWISPDKPGHQPQYGSREFTKEDRHNKLLQILGGTSALLSPFYLKLYGNIVRSDGPNVPCLSS